jgi:hypothetical protein
MAVSISPSPCVGLAEATRLAYISPATAAPTPVKAKALNRSHHLEPGQPRGLAIAADGVEPPAVACLLQHDPDDERHRIATIVRFGSTSARSSTVPITGPPRAKSLKDRRDVPAEDRAPAADDEGKAAEDGQRRKRRHEGQDADEADEKPVEEPARQSDASAAATAAGTGQPCTNSAAATTPESDAIEPTDRSKSPMTMTTVMRRRRPPAC